ncbi:5'-deoxynucleotidase [Oleiphilus sp. HI0009]|nr:5'-deoxynucleotidase [Oleiphilus sp. HI0009]KZX81496.1 5'-deoxynucleotidase [Oleiphilus sp. HI0009]
MNLQSTFLGWVLRMPLIKRWGLMHSFKVEDIAQHSHQVGVIAHLLGVIGNTQFGKNWNCEKLATLGLYHEMSETKLQDQNSITKYSDPTYTKEYKKLERLAEEDCLSTLPKNLQEYMRPFIIQDEVDKDEKRLVKAADNIAAYLKCLDEMKFNNPEFEDAKINLEYKLSDAQQEFEEVAYFMRTFVRKCTATVDELTPTTV